MPASELTGGTAGSDFGSSGTSPIVQQQLFAHYPDCQVQHLPDKALEPPVGLVTWTADLWLKPSKRPAAARAPGGRPGAQAGPRTPGSASITWYEAVNFCKRLSELPDEKKAGRLYRLPTEAEWEYACRARSTTKFSYGDDPKQLEHYAWFAANAEDRTHPVGQLRPNAWGLYDMHGNVWERCDDAFDETFYRRSQKEDPRGPQEGILRVHRGGSFDYPAEACRSACRTYHASHERHNLTGFRVVCEVGGKTSTGSAPPTPEPAKVELPGKPISNSIDMNLAFIPADKFIMGSPDSEPGREGYEGPQHEVTITKPFYMGRLKPNAWGLYDVHGNLWEWCDEAFDAGFYKKSPKEDPRGPAEGNLRVIRGGCLNEAGEHCRSAYRAYCPSKERNNRVGFRVVCEIPRANNVNPNPATPKPDPKKEEKPEPQAKKELVHPTHGKEIWLAVAPLKGVEGMTAEGIAVAHQFEKGTYIMASSSMRNHPRAVPSRDGWRTRKRPSGSPWEPSPPSATKITNSNSRRPRICAASARSS